MIKTDGMYTRAAAQIAMGAGKNPEQIFATAKHKNVHRQGMKTMSFAENSKIFKRMRNTDMINASVKYEIAVAAAAPLIPKNFIKIGVRDNFDTIATIAAKREALVFPEACSMPAPTHEKLKNTADGAMMARSEDKSDESNKRAKIAFFMAIKPAAHGSEITNDSLMARDESEDAFLVLQSLMFSESAGSMPEATAVAMDTGKA